MTAQDDRLFQALREAATQGDLLLDPRLDALARGELSKEERAAFAAQAKEPELAEAALEAFEPLDAEAEERIVARILGAGAKDGKLDAALPVVSAPARPLLLRPKKRAPVLIALGSALALAAGIALVLRAGAPGETGLPAYELLVAGGAREQRGPPEPSRGALRATRGTRIEIVARPLVTPSGAVEARAFLLHGERAEAWLVPIQSARGAFRIEGPVDELMRGVSNGDHVLVIAVGRPGELPEASEIADTAHRERFRTLRVPLFVEEGAQGDPP